MQLERVLNTAVTLPELPPVATQLFTLLDSPESSDASLSKLLKRHPVLLSELEQTAKNIFPRSLLWFSSPDANHNVDQEILCALSLVICIAQSLEHSADSADKHYWQHSLKRARLTHWLAQRAIADPTRAFTCSLILHLADWLKYRSEEEIRLSPDEIGAQLAETWKMPNDIVEGVRHQSRPQNQEKPPVLAITGYIADYILDSSMEDWSQEEIIDHFPEELALYIGMDLPVVFEGIASRPWEQFH